MDQGNLSITQEEKNQVNTKEEKCECHGGEALSAHFFTALTVRTEP